MKSTPIVNSQGIRTESDHTEHAKVRFLNIAHDQIDRRLDNFLLSLVPGVPRSRVYRAIRSGEVRVNKGRSHASYRLQLHDVVRVPPFRIKPKRQVQVGLHSQQTLLAAIIERHRAFYVLNKPAGWAVHGGSGVSLGVIETLRRALPDHYLELAHRLDRATSGCLLIARKRAFLRAFHRQMENSGVAKTYLLLVDGHWDYGRYRCELALRTDTRKNGERHVQVHTSGKYCRTDFKPIEFFSGATLLEAQLVTGRTHQIRVHSAALGHPILGDQRYGTEKSNTLTQKLKLESMFLHANSLSFEYPSENPCHISAPLRPELVRVIDYLEAGRNR